MLQGMVSQLSSGPCLAMTVESESYGPNTPQEFRNFAGPSDPVRFIPRYHKNLSHIKLQLGFFSIFGSLKNEY